ncbi:MAG TPA: ABC transporter substrate binding protein, partial [Negativicutes bacterium]|nr:ABC transporter substrate binding protein [Negativicutes bacterium]
FKYSKRNIDIIITTDDAALDFALKNRAEIFSDAPIVFSGVNEAGVARIAGGQDRVTGVREIIDPANTFKMLLKMRPNTKEIYVIYDDSESGVSTGRLTINAILGIEPGISIHSMNKLGIDELLAQVKMAPADSAILITTYYSDYYGKVIGFEEICRRVSSVSKAPVFHLYDFGIGNGAVGGSLLRGKADGRRAGAMAVRVLKGEDISGIPIEMMHKNRFVFDYEKLVQYGIPLNRVPEGSEIVNKPFSFFEAYKSLVITTLMIFALLVAFIVQLVYYLRKTRTMSRELKNNNEELVKSDSILRQQYEELNRVQKELVSSEERYSTLFRRMLNGFIVFEPYLNSEGRMVDILFGDINPAFALQTGFRREEAIGRTWRELYGFPNKNLGIYRRILETGEPEHFETFYHQNQQYYHISAFRISEGKLGAVVDNITDYRHAINEITTLNEELEQRVSERTEELQSVVNELEAFTYTVSHDLKSPLRAVDGYSRIILEDYEPELVEDAAQMLQNIRAICRDMIDMINKLLQYSTTSRAEMSKEKVDTGAMIRSIFNELMAADQGRNIRLAVETGLPEVYADKVMLRQVFCNILSNGIKFTRTREQAVISMGCTITAEEYIFYIKDNGVGFDMEYSRKLFGIFQRLHTADEFEGSGIGLVTVKKIIQRHGGRVWIEGKIDEGAEVFFTLPVSYRIA